MLDAPSPATQPDSETAAQRFFAVQTLLSSPSLARFYTELLINSPTTVPAARDRLDASKSTAYQHTNRLEELGLSEELNELENGSSIWETKPVAGTWTDKDTITIGPAVIAAYGVTTIHDDLELFVDRHGKAALVPAVTETLRYMTGEQTRRGVADALNVPAVEGIAVSQVIEPVIGVVADADPTLGDLTFEVEIRAQGNEDSLYHRDP